MTRNVNALHMRDRDLRAGPKLGWEYVWPGGIRAQDRRHVARFLELLGEYEQVQDRLSTRAVKLSRCGYTASGCIGGNE